MSRETSILLIVVIVFNTESDPYVLKQPPFYFCIYLLSYFDVRFDSPSFVYII